LLPDLHSNAPSQLLEEVNCSGLHPATYDTTDTKTLLEMFRWHTPVDV
jgi:hypothetical protein